MGWERASTYRARIGGVIYRNVDRPITVNGVSPIALTREPESNQLGVSLEITDAAGRRIVSVSNNEIALHDEQHFELIEARGRRAVIHRRTRHVHLDLDLTKHDDWELELSCMLFGPKGYPIALHPDRTKVGKGKPNAPPNISGLTITSERTGVATAIAVDGTRPLFVFDMAIENLGGGLELRLGASNGRG